MLFEAFEALNPQRPQQTCTSTITHSTHTHTSPPTPPIMVAISVSSSARDVPDEGLDLTAWKKAHLMDDVADVATDDTIMPRENLGHYVRVNAAEHPDDHFVSDEFGHRMTFAEFSEMATLCTQLLQSKVSPPNHTYTRAPATAPPTTPPPPQGTKQRRGKYLVADSCRIGSG